jgi:spore germination protein YaaH
VAELSRPYDAIGKNPYSGVTLDFEGLRGSALKSGYNDFLTELSAKLKPLGKSLYVAVQPASADGQYYDGFDYRTIGQLADKVILMAHDYNVLSLNSYIGTTWFKTTALTPIDQVYYALRAITDPKTGVENKDKIALAISFSSLGWKISGDRLISGTPVKPATATIYSRLTASGTVMGYSDTYKNPYITYTTEAGEQIFLWYEDSRSVGDKVQLAKLFGIHGVSLWRLGQVPNYMDEGLYYNVMESLK